MKILCIDCDTRMRLDRQQATGDDTIAIAFRCPACGRQIAMLTNAMESQLVSSLGVVVGGAQAPAQPMAFVRDKILDSAPAIGAARPEAQATPSWTEASRQRLSQAPPFVQGMVRQLYNEWAMERGIGEITPAVMDAAREDLGMQGM